MSKRSMRKLRGICSDALRAASLSAEFIAFGQANTHFSRIEGLERLRFKKRSRHCPAIAQALGLLSSSALPSCATDRLSARDRAEINQGESLTRRVQSAPRSLSARCKTFDNQQGKDVKAKQHWCPLKQDHPRGPTFGTGPGPGKVSFNVAPNLGARRSGSISVSNQTFHVDQEGGTPACTFSINPSHAVIDDLGGNLRVVVTAPGSCRWTAASNAGWLSVASGAAGSGTASVSIHVASNTGGARNGTVTIPGQTFAVSQGGGACGALDVTAETSVLRGGYSLLQFTTYIYSGTITVRNISDVTLHPPLYVVLVGLPNHLGYPYGVTSFGALQTTCFTPAGDNMYLLPTGDLPPGSSTPISPLFFTQSLFGGISYQPRVLSGTPTH